MAEQLFRELYEDLESKKTASSTKKHCGSTLMLTPTEADHDALPRIYDDLLQLGIELSTVNQFFRQDEDLALSLEDES